MKPALPFEAIVEAVERDLGAISQWNPVSQGEESQAFGIHVGGESLVLRINRLAEGFQKDVFCARRFASPALPIPEVLSIGIVGQQAYCVSRRAAGLTLQDLPAAALPGAVAPVVKVLRAMAETSLDETQGFGRFNDRGIGEHASWRDFLAVIADHGHYDWDRVDAVIGAGWSDRHLDRLTSLVPQCPEIRRLVHGDFGSNNVLVDGAVITGVIDWSEALFGDPLYDVANIFFWRPWLACMEAQARYFEEHEPEAMGDPLVLSCYQLRIGLQQVCEAALSGSEQDLRWVMARCETLVVGPRV
ncbi:phosphotransferase family protein [Rhizobium sp. NPDC090279]|uniref:phosphotransferase family protein n=1 Tax=Rhizobium sp. NPDC090279 TaxID=3364499 RepID=UPI00383AF7F6